MIEECLCKASEVLIFPCSGASNCGQIANQAAVQLTKEGTAKMYCLAGIGAHNNVMLDTTRAAKRVMALDGCSTACAKKTLEHAGIVITDHVEVTGEGIEKVHDFNISLEAISEIAAKARKMLAEVIVPG